MKLFETKSFRSNGGLYTKNQLQDHNPYKVKNELTMIRICKEIIA
jgi:hypothetical protein